MFNWFKRRNNNNPTSRTLENSSTKENLSEAIPKMDHQCVLVTTMILANNKHYIVRRCIRCDLLEVTLSVDVPLSMTPPPLPPGLYVKSKTDNAVVRIITKVLEEKQHDKKD